MTDATLIDGKAFSEKLVERVAERAAELSAIIGRPPALAVVLVGDNAASAVYVRNKIERTTAAGMRSVEHRLDADTGQAELLALIDELNNDDAIDGILVQLPLPDQIDEDAVINAIFEHASLEYQKDAVSYIIDLHNKTWDPVIDDKDCRQYINFVTKIMRKPCFFVYKVDPKRQRHAKSMKNASQDAPREYLLAKNCIFWAIFGSRLQFLLAELEFWCLPGA